RTKSRSCSSVSRKIRATCTSTSTMTVATIGAGILKIGSLAGAADRSVKIAPDAWRHRSPWPIEQATGTERPAALGGFRKNKREDQGPPFCSLREIAQ